MKLKSLLSLTSFVPYIIVLLFLATSAYADKPIPTDTSALTMSDYDNYSFATDTEAYVEGYKKHGKRNEAWDKEAIEFIEMCVKCFSGAPYPPSLDHLKAKGKILFDKGCNDPLVLYGYGYAYDRLDNQRGAEKYLVAAVEGLPDSEYPPHLLGSVASRLARFLEVWERPDEARVYHQIAVNAFIRAAEAEPDEFFAQRVLVNRFELQLDEYLPLDIAKTFIEGLQLVGGLNACTLNTCMGIYHCKAGWDARGKGFANTVGEDGWDIFANEQEKARSYLVKAHELDPSRPEAATVMIKVAMAGHAGPGESERSWFDKAVAAQMDWPSAYSRILWSMRPRWGGSHEQMFEFGLECARTERFDTQVPYKLIKVLMDIDREEKYSRRFWRLNRVDQIAIPVLDQLASDPTQTHNMQAYRTIQAGIFWALDKFDDAKRMLDLIDSDLKSGTLQNLRMSRREILDDVHAFTGKFAETITEADSLHRVKNFKGAVKAYENIITQIEDDSKLMSILRDRIVTAEIEGQFKTGQWVDLKFEDGNPGWRVRAGVWHSSSPESIKGGPQHDGLYLISNFDVGTQFEITGEIDLSNLARRDSSNAAIVFQYRDYVYSDNSFWLSFQIYARQKRAWIGYRFWKGSGKYLPLGRRREYVYDFHLKSWGEEAVLHLNDKLMFADQITIDRYFIPGQAIGLGGSYSSSSAGYAIYKNLKLRRLDVRPAELHTVEP